MNCYYSRSMNKWTYICGDRAALPSSLPSRIALILTCHTVLSKPCSFPPTAEHTITLKDNIVALEEKAVVVTVQSR